MKKVLFGIILILLFFPVSLKALNLPTDLNTPIGTTFEADDGWIYELKNRQLGILGVVIWYRDGKGSWTNGYIKNQFDVQFNQDVLSFGFAGAESSGLLYVRVKYDPDGTSFWKTAAYNTKGTIVEYQTRQNSNQKTYLKIPDETNLKSQSYVAESNYVRAYVGDGENHADFSPAKLAQIRSNKNGYTYKVEYYFNKPSDADIESKNLTYTSLAGNKVEYNHRGYFFPFTITVVFWQKIKEIENKQDPQPSCSLDIKTDISNNCEDGTQSIINDPEMSCILQNSSNADVREKYLEINNKYCKIFKREDIVFNGISKTDTLAGRYFDYEDQEYDNYQLPVIKAEKTYVTESIDYESFKKDFDVADKEVAIAWDNYVKGILWNRVYSSKRQLPDVSTGSCKRQVCSGEGENRSCHEVTTGSYTTTKYEFALSYVYTNYDGSKTTIKKGNCSKKSGCKSSDSCRVNRYDTSALKKIYDQKVQVRQDIIDTYTNCSTFNINYKKESEVKIKYDDDLYGDTVKVGENTKVIYDSEWVASDGNDSCNSSSNGCDTGIDYQKISYYNCNGETACYQSTNKLEIPTTKITTKKITTITSFYNKTKYYSNVPDGIVTPNNKGTKRTTNYIKLDSDIYPINLYEKDGNYDISIDYYDLGDEAKYSDKNATYTCSYKVTNKSVDCVGKSCKCTQETCSEGNKGFVYRTVDLSDMFPNRTPGSNWSGQTNLIETIKKSASTIYTKEPKYTVTLNPSNMRKIRSYNKLQEFSGGYMDFNLKCATGSGKSCTSNFLSTIVEDGYASSYKKTEVNN